MTVILTRSIIGQNDVYKSPKWPMEWFLLFLTWCIVLIRDKIYFRENQLKLVAKET